MTVNPTLKHAQQAKKIADDLSVLAKEIRNENIGKRDCEYGTSYKRISSLHDQLISMHVYLDAVIDRLEWRQYVWQTFKKELGNAGWALSGIIIGISVYLSQIPKH